MGREANRPIEELRRAIDCLPVATRMAMLDGISSNQIIVGAYTDRAGGVCPMLAAHRCGGRTSFVSFAHAWDRFTRAKRSRRATEREVLILRTHLEASLLADASAVDFRAAIREHRELQAAAGARVRPGDPDRSRELGRKPGWAWMRPFRRLDDYERALERVEAAGQQRERELV